MRNIVERLRLAGDTPSEPELSAIIMEAADEIEKLRLVATAVRPYQDIIEELRREIKLLREMSMTEGQKRLHEILRRHVRDEDKGLSDDEFVRTVVRRYYLSRAMPLIDPNE